MQRYTPWLLLVLLFLVQLYSLLMLAASARPLSQAQTIVLVADVSSLVIGAALAWALWHTRVKAVRHAPLRTATSIAPYEPVTTSRKPSAQTEADTSINSPRTTPQRSERDCEPADISLLLEELAHKAQHDSLTGLPNRSLALDRLEQALQRAQRQQHSVAVLFVDLNGFKPLNDTYGHDFGDKVLRKTAERLRRSVREVDTVARLGGDEFLIIMEQVSDRVAIDTAQTLSTIVRQPVSANEAPVSVSMSCGIAMYPQHGTVARHLLRVADAAMYQSKRSYGQPVLALRDEEAPGQFALLSRFNETTSINPKMLDTWEGSLRTLRSLPD